MARTGFSLYAGPRVRRPPAGPAGHPLDHGGCPYRDVPAPRRGQPERGITGVPRPVGDQREHLRPGVRQGDHGGEADVLRADDQRPPGQPLPRQVHPPLQFPCGHHPGRAVAGDQARRPGPLPAAGRQQHRPGGHGLDPRRAGQRDAVLAIAGQPAARGTVPAVPAGHRGAQPDVRPGGGRRVRIPARVAGPGQHPAQVPRAEPGVRAVPGNAARLIVAVGDHDPARAEPPQFHRGGQPGGPRPDDEHVGAGPGVRPPGTPAGLRPLRLRRGDLGCWPGWAGRRSCR